jgi:NTP pyrophosphatase (non-canonical NTP hydrolase)
MPLSKMTVLVEEAEEVAIYVIFHKQYLDVMGLEAFGLKLKYKIINPY